MIKFWILTFTAVFVLNVHANSFVGNGGSEGDVELLVTLKQIQEIFQLIETLDQKTVPLCTCSRPYQGRAICEPLAVLNEAQVGFCATMLYQQAPEILKLVRQRDLVKVRWTSDSIEVNENGQLRAADAVANRETHEITINLKHFRAMKAQERVFLLTHELMHFTDLKGKAVTDVGAVGPFVGDQGARQLIDSMAAASATLQGAYPKDIRSYGAKLQRSQAWKSVWFSAEIGSSSPTSSYSDNFQFNSYQRTQLAARYQWTHWGVMLIYRSQDADKKVLDTADLKEQLNTWGAGVTYKIMPFSDPLSFWGQSHVLLQGLVERVQATYSYHDAYNGESVSTSVFGASLGASYYLPLFWGLWTYVGVNYEIHPYKISDANIDLNYHTNLLSGFLGVSYGF